MSGADALSRRGALKAAAAASLLTATRAQALTDPRAANFIGVREDGVAVFKGIRYARTARFARPVLEPLPTQLTRATMFGPVAPQRGLADTVQSEACQTLAIWTPDPRLSARRPVMVYFHGGAYAGGTAFDPLTWGGKLAAAQDVVVVTVNHRLNAFGYSWLKPFGAGYADSGNLGQLDLIAALRWVRANIAAFGGDPARVMVFGQSGGGAKIATLMAMPAAAGLFHAAATMSGQQVVASGPGHAWARTQALMARLKLAPSDVETLRTMDLVKLVEGLDAVDPIIGGAVYFGPVLDMTNLPRHPFWPDAAPQSLAIPMILGNTRDETRAFIDPRGPKLQGLAWDNLAERIAPEIKVDLDTAWVVDRYRTQYSDWSPERVFYAATTAGRSWPGQVIEADARAAAGAKPTWVYQLDRPSPLDPLRGAAHTDDIPYVFGTLDAPGSRSGRDAAARKLSGEMMGAFAQAARTGNPGWSPYRLPSRATMVFDVSSRVIDDPRRWERELWSAAPYIQPGS
ncbi:MAG: carboxylesterase family protein [Croceibacterium sp.]